MERSTYGKLIREFDLNSTGQEWTEYCEQMDFYFKAATDWTIFCREASDFLSATKYRPVCGRSGCGSDPIFCREEISGILDPEKSCQISSASVWQLPIIYRDSFARQPMRSEIESTRKPTITKGRVSRVC